MLLYRFPSPPLETNAILIAARENQPAAVIDPAYESTDKILQQAKKKGLKIEKILLTHSHWDHFADAKILKEKTGAPLYVHPMDAKNIETPGSDGVPSFFVIQPVRVDGFLQDGETVAVGSLKLEVIHTPGHSPGCVCFYLHEQATLISGDTLFHGCCGRIDLSTGDPKKMWLSLKKLAGLPSGTRVVPGHGPDTELSKEPWISRAEELFS